MVDDPQVSFSQETLTAITQPGAATTSNRDLSKKQATLSPFSKPMVYTAASPGGQRHTGL